MIVKTFKRSLVELVEVSAQLFSEQGRLAVRAADLGDRGARVARAAAAFFGLRASESLAAEPPIAVFREKSSGLIRVVHKQIVLRWEKKCSAAQRKQIMQKHALETIAKNSFTSNQIVVRVIDHKKTGVELLELSKQLMDLEEIVFATPDFVSEFRRSTIPTIIRDQWHLRNTAAITGQKAGEDVKAKEAWNVTMGKRSIVVAVLDDGVDVEHPNLKSNIRRTPDVNEPRDKVGRDFYVPDDLPDHFDPRPKLFQFPYQEMRGNDIHGTPCAGVIAASGKVGGVRGIAPKCRILPVKIFHADALASDARVADAIRYASQFAAVLSCSWSGGESLDIELALQDAAEARGGKGAMVFCAAGNENQDQVGYPARSPNAIAVGASTDQGQLADYSNRGPEIWVVAPSSGGKRGIFTTDVAYANRGFNTGNAAAGGTDGLHTNSFGGTSSATPLTAGVAALVLSKKPSLTAAEVKDILKASADKIGSDHDPNTGHSNAFGYGRVNAKRAVDLA